MKISSPCSAVAALLTEKYSTSLDLHEVNNFTFGEIVESHGILLSMCMFGGACTLPPGRDDHVSASWIHGEITGPHSVIVPSEIGMALKPGVSTLNCMYPIDGGTDDRDSEGCGPYKIDEIYGSQGAKHLGPVGRFMFRKETTRYKNINFGRNTAWLDIPCSLFFGNIFFSSMRLLRKGDGGSAEWEFDHGFFSRSYEAIMGHPVCNLEADIEPKEANTWFLTIDPEPWNPATDWRNALSIQQGLVQTYPQSHIWNEIVMEAPKTLSDLVEAIFYYITPNMDDYYRNAYNTAAHERAKLLGVPVVGFVLSDSGDLSFSCPEEGLRHIRTRGAPQSDQLSFS